MEPVPTQGLSLNIFDIIVVALIGYGMFRGYKKGMIKSVAGIIGIILSIIFCHQLLHLRERLACCPDGH
jgi:uncharacterized membrane protein required for colicin V production